MAITRNTRSSRAVTPADISSASTPNCSNWSTISPTNKFASCSAAATTPRKVYAAYKAAIEHKGAPTVILAKTIKGYGLGEAGEGRNITHQQKKLNEKELREFRARFGIPISDEEMAETPFFRPPPDSLENASICWSVRKKLGGFLPEARR